MFTGSAKKTRAVSLRGNSKEEDRTDFLRRARVEREARKQERHRTQCCTTIQRVWRGRVIARRARQDYRSDWDKKMHDLARLQAILAASGHSASFSPPVPVLMGLVREFIFFSDLPTVDSSRFRSLCSLLMNSAESAQLLSSIKLESREVWLLRMSQFFVRSLYMMVAGGELAGWELLIVLSPQERWDNQNVTGCEELLSRLAVAENDRALRIRTASGRTSMSLFRALRLSLLPSGGAVSMQNDMLCRLSLQSLGLFTAAVAGGGNIDVTQPRRFDALQAYGEVILPLPNLLLEDVKVKLLTPFLSHEAKAWWQLISTLAMNQGLLAKWSVGDIARSISNLLELQRSYGWGRGSVDCPHVSSLFALLYSLLQRLPVHALLAQGELSAMDLEEPQDLLEAVEEEVKDLRVLVPAMTKRNLQRAPKLELSSEDAAIATKTLWKLVDSSVLGKLFDAVIPLTNPVSEGRSDVDTVMTLCSLFGDLLVHTSGANVSALASTGSLSSTQSLARAVVNSLAFGNSSDPLLPRLWSYLSSMMDLDAYASSAKVASQLPSAALALFLFCSACSHKLLSMDDDEFYARQVLMPMTSVRSLTVFLKSWLCRLYWTGDSSVVMGGSYSSESQKLVDAQLMLAATRLFNQLYERNTRRSYLEAKEWFWPLISPHELQPPEVDGRDAASIYSFFYGSSRLAYVLTNIPQVIPFLQRVIIFKQLMESDKSEHQSIMMIHDSAKIRVRRQHLYEDSFTHLNPLATDLRQRIKITFVNEYGMEEAGIDGGGLLKEFIDALTKRAFDPQYGMFVATADQLLYPNVGAALIAADYLDHFEFLGRVLGKALYEGILVEPQFSAVFLNKLLGRHNFIDDLYTLDPELYRNLVKLKALVHEGQNVEDLCLTFSVTTTDFGENRQWDLIDGGSKVNVTNQSVIRYIHLMANFKLNLECAQQCRAFLRGFRDLVPVEWIRLFNPQELQMLIGGSDNKQLDVENLKQYTNYAGGYHPSQPIMQWFWEAVSSFTPEEQGQFLKFVTSCSRPPLLGFQHLNPPICIQKVPLREGGEDGEGSERLPTSATCVNVLKLPGYHDKKTLTEKLLYAINANAGFDLT